jgi:hypothetical protein
VTASRKLISSGIFCSINVIFTFPKDKNPREICVLSKVDEGASSVGYPPKIFAPFLNCEPARCQDEPLIFIDLDPVRWKETLSQKNQVLVNEPWCIE